MYYLRTKSGLEVDLLVEGAAGAIRPYEFKLSATPRMEMAESIRRFREQFAALKPQTGGVVSLATQPGPLAEGVRLVPLADYVAEIAAGKKG